MEKFFTSILLGFLPIFSVCQAINELRIAPSASVQTKSVGSNVLLTCQPNVDNKDLISELIWTDPRGVIIDKNYPIRRITVEKMEKYSRALIIQSFSQSDTGNYTCKGQYASNLPLIKSVRLESVIPITWEDAPEVQNPIINNSYKVRCKVSANPAAHIDWTKNGDTIRPDGRYVIMPDGLLIKNVDEGDDGVYICRAIVIETGELASRNIRVEVHTSPKITISNSSFTLIEGETASVVCTATGKPKPSVQWIKRDTREDLSRKSRFGVDELTGALTINAVQEEDDGFYKCVALNAAAKAEMDVKLSVVVKPKIQLFTNQTTVVGLTTKLECKARGKPFPNISFQKFGIQEPFLEGKNIYNPRITVERVELPETNEVLGVLRIEDAERKDDGLYSCIASNQGGVARKTGHLQVEFAPSFENQQMREAWSWSGRPTVNLTCLAESIPNATITWRRNNAEVTQIMSPSLRQIGHGPFSILEVNTIDNRMYGLYKCIARNKHGEAEHDIMLREATAPNVVAQVTPAIVTATTIEFHIVPSSFTSGLNITSYTAQYSPSTNEYMKFNKTWPVGSRYVIEGLQPDTVYNGRIAARNAVGYGNWHGFQPIRTLRRSPPAAPTLNFLGDVQNGVIQSPLNSKIEIRWNIPVDNGEPITKYLLRYCVQSSRRDESLSSSCYEQELRVTDFPGTSYMLSDLHPNTMYRVELRAVNKMGVSEPGYAYYRTAKGIDKDLLVASSQGGLALSSTAIIAIVVGSLLVILLLIDVSCFALNSAGFLYLICGNKRNKDDSRVASEDKELLKENGRSRMSFLDERSKKDTQMTYDDKSSSYKTTFIGKNSEV